MNLELGLPAAVVLKYLNRRRLELAKSQPEHDELKTFVHKMRGNAATFGLPVLGFLAAKIEDELISRQAPDSKSLELWVNQLRLEVDSQIARSLASI